MTGKRGTEDAVTARRTRPEMRADSRARLLDAALDLILDGGIAAATIRGICERAGFTQGAFYTYFSNKDDVLFTLVDQHMGEVAVALDSIVADTAPATLDQLLDRTMASLDALSVRSARSLLIIELNLHAQRDAAFAKRFEPVKRRYEASFASVTDHLLERADLKASMPSVELARILLALWSGSVLQSSEPSTALLQMKQVFTAIAEPCVPSAMPATAVLDLSK